MAGITNFVNFDLYFLSDSDILDFTRHGGEVIVPYWKANIGKNVACQNISSYIDPQTSMQGMNVKERKEGEQHFCSLYCIEELSINLVFDVFITLAMWITIRTSNGSAVPSAFLHFPTFLSMTCNDAECKVSLLHFDICISLACHNSAQWQGQFLGRQSKWGS